jgi:hypothetical protein
MDSTVIDHAVDVGILTDYPLVAMLRHQSEKQTKQ